MARLRSLSPEPNTGRRLREKGAQKTLVAATRFSPEKFALVQNAVAELRDNLIDYAKGQD